ncbi:MAG: hypothetical protein ACKVYV_01895, partial [Limisphaerales bacterium]
MKQSLLLASAACLLALTSASRAEEGGSAHYMPGGVASFIDAFPGKPGAIATLGIFTYYDGSAPANRTLPLGGLLAADVDATVYAGSAGVIY